MSAASGHQGLWTDARYPGDTVRILALKRGDEFGSIRIQHMGEFVRVGSFLPGVIEEPPGDSPKVWPEKSTTCDNNFLADNQFDEYVQEAYAALWQRTYSEDENG